MQYRANKRYFGGIFAYCLYYHKGGYISVHVEKYLHQFLFVNIFYQIANFYFAYFQRFTPYFLNRAKKSPSFLLYISDILRTFAMSNNKKTFGGAP